MSITFACASYFSNTLCAMNVVIACRHLVVSGMGSFRFASATAVGRKTAGRARTASTLALAYSEGHSETPSGLQTRRSCVVKCCLPYHRSNLAWSAGFSSIPSRTVLWCASQTPAQPSMFAAEHDALRPFLGPCDIIETCRTLFFARNAASSLTRSSHNSHRSGRRARARTDCRQPRQSD
jgi:hypothetical protein